MPTIVISLGDVVQISTLQHVTRRTDADLAVAQSGRRGAWRILNHFPGYLLDTSVSSKAVVGSCLIAASALFFSSRNSAGCQTLKR